ncbi:hypothetical protein JXI42_05640 [bacterium]|nr:hypothetical protein [bacterium]
MIDLIKKTFYPEPYSKIESIIEESILHLSRNSIFGSQYVLLVNNFNAEEDLKQLIKRKRIKLKKYYNTYFFINIGVLQVFIGKYSDWEHRVNEAKPDWHGARSVILQGILFIDPEEKKYRLYQSHWRPIKFGNLIGQIDKVHYLLGKIGAL